MSRPVGVAEVLREQARAEQRVGDACASEMPFDAVVGDAGVALSPSNEEEDDALDPRSPVSYTHLTLPTILLV